MTDTLAPTPAPSPDLTGLRLTHRALRSDIQRLSTLADGIAVSGRPVAPARARAIAAYVHRYTAAVLHHHAGEDRVLWPVIAAAVGQALADGDVTAGTAAAGIAGLAALTDDHAALAPLRDTCDATATLFGEDPAPHGRRLAETLTALRARLVPHIAVEERDVFPVITRHVSAADYTAAEAMICAATPVAEAPWLRAWLMSYATADDLPFLALDGDFAYPWPAADAPAQGYAAHAEEVFGTTR
ncbi:hypothetical protein GCM10018785_62180 [Streptomyces longispororuber]|uniref:Hemerythrin-like domain-containing protein n=1 Tax=Streptomyces longispororuber TaxID=68230 RepID=A0A919DWT8_9ACTN|nr:hemerythrin domain-containing protein [Streptomyces longispororuber]GHE86005.1 hypothetical protein GCM10018785_62180 [Streptomyces longispororuber]